MRPVLRGDRPTDDNGNLVHFTDHKEARKPLSDRLGRYCSYCEIPLLDRVEVEHIQPQKHNPALRLEWSNFLLACNHCNRAKWDTPINLPDYYWPDRDNTYRAFIYPEDLPKRANPALTPAQQAIAGNTLRLTGLNRMPGAGRTPATWRRRWEIWLEAWGTIRESRIDLLQADSPCMRNRIVNLAKNTGFWSVWMTVFADDADMRSRLIDAFPGTRDSGCFDDQGRPVPRPGGML